jgi:DNA-binding transcriptional MocR family regulator
MREFHPVRTRSVAGDVISQLVDRLKSGELKVGDVLPGERVLAAQMDVSRPTVSAAMNRLADAGVLRRRPGRQGNAEIISIWVPDELADKPTTSSGSWRPAKPLSRGSRSSRRSGPPMRISPRFRSQSTCWRPMATT